MSEETFLDRLKKEHQELVDKNKKLANFFCSIEYGRVSEEECVLLNRQQMAASSLEIVLRKRIELHSK